MTVVRLYAPGGGWWTRDAGALSGAERARYIGLNPDIARRNDRMQPGIRNCAATFPAEVAGLDRRRRPSGSAPITLDACPAALNGTVDRVLIFREMHNMLALEHADREMHGDARPAQARWHAGHRAAPRQRQCARQLYRWQQGLSARSRT